MSATAILYLAAAMATPPPTECPLRPSAELTALAYDEFDTATTAHGWRTLLNRGCVDAAVATLAAYRAANSTTMSKEQKYELSFHIGQALAMAGRDAESIPHFEAATRPGVTAEWSAYVDATVGFIRKDRARLNDAAARYEKLAGPGSLRLQIIRGFLACFGKAYQEAMHCGM